MSMNVQNVNNQQQQIKKAKAFALAEVPILAAGGAFLGYKFAKPWVKGGQVSDKFVKEAMNECYKGLPKTVPSPTTIFDHLSKEEIKDLFGGCFKNLKKGSIKAKEELKGSENLVHDLAEKTIKSMKKNSAIKWGAFAGGVALLSTILTMKALKKVEQNNIEVK